MFNNVVGFVNLYCKAINYWGYMKRRYEKYCMIFPFLQSLIEI